MKVIKALILILVVLSGTFVSSCHQPLTTPAAVPPLTTSLPSLTNIAAADQPQTLNALSTPEAAIPLTTTVPAATNTETPSDRPARNNILSAFRLTVSGLVDSPLNLTYDSILGYPSTTQKVILVCPGVFETNKKWTGVPLSIILDEAGIKPQAAKIAFFAPDGYSSVISLADGYKEGTFLAYQVDGQVLSDNDGFPLRLVVKDQVGAVWVRQLERIEVK